MALAFAVTYLGMAIIIGSILFCEARRNPSDWHPFNPLEEEPVWVSLLAAVVVGAVWPILILNFLIKKGWKK